MLLMCIHICLVDTDLFNIFIRDFRESREFRKFRVANYKFKTQTDFTSGKTNALKRGMNSHNL